MQGRPTLGGGAGSSIASKRAEMPDPRPLNSANWKAEASQKVSGTLLAANVPIPLSRTHDTPLYNCTPRCLSF